MLVLVTLVVPAAEAVGGAVATPAVMVVALREAERSALHKHHVVEGASWSLSRPVSKRQARETRNGTQQEHQ